MIENFHVGPNLPAAHSHRPDWPGTQEPVQDIQIVAVLLDDKVAGVLAISEPVPQLLHLRIRVRNSFERIVIDPKSAGISQRSDLARLDALVRFEIHRTVALLKAEADILLRVGFAGGGDYAFDAFQVHARGLLAINVFARLHGRFQHARMLERRRGDHDGVDVRGCQQLFEILVYLGTGGLDLLSCGFEAIVVQVAQRSHAGARIGIYDGRVIRSTAATDGLRAHDGECCSGEKIAPR